MIRSAVLVILCVFNLSLFNNVNSVGLTEDFVWTRINYDWSYFRNQRATRHYLVDSILFPGITNQNVSDTRTNGPPSNIDYQYETNIPMGANVWRNKLFITVPRRRLGVPSTLNYVPLDSSVRRNPPLRPYPTARVNLYPSSLQESFVSVYRVAVDACDRLWFVDTGLIELPGNQTRVKPPTLYVIDLNSDQIVQRHPIPEGNRVANTNLASLTIDTTKSTCKNAFAYMPDFSGYGLIVYSLQENRSWRITHNYFYLEPLDGEFSISGHSFQWNDGVFSVELGRMRPDGHRDAYFHSMAGLHFYRVSTRVLRNETLASRSYHQDNFQVVGHRGDRMQTSAADLHPQTNTILLGLVNQNALGCWKVSEKSTNVGIIQKDDQRMIYPCDVKIYNDKVYLLTNTMPEFLYGRLDYSRGNFRVWSAHVRDAIRGTVCEDKPTGGGSYAN